MRLEIELVPKTIWNSNVRSFLTPKEWNKIRKRQYDKAGYKCEICSAEAKLHCHEKWQYEDEKHVQKLTGLMALCEKCHMIKHAGFSMHTEEGKRKYDRNKLIEHFCKVNNCSEEGFLKHEKEAFDKWKERSMFKWEQDFGLHKNLINQELE
jgi:hypothetical protein